MSKYDVNPDEDYQPGSSTVLKNYLNTCDLDLISQEETKALKAVYQYYIKHINADDFITNAMILEMHKKWLGKIYPFAGKYRTVLMSKSGFVFSAPGQVEKLMHDFEKNELKLYTPCREKSIEKIAFEMAVVHTEFIIIHSFREGNGRLGRMIVSIMGLQAGYPPLNFESIDDKKNIAHDEYIKAIHNGLDKDYSMMKNIFKKILSDSMILDLLVFLIQILVLSRFVKKLHISLSHMFNRCS